MRRAALFFALAIALEPAARACSVVPCREGAFFPAPGTRVTTNVPALWFLPSSGSEPLSLVGPGGGQVAFVLEDDPGSKGSLVRAPGFLQPGEYWFTRGESCAGATQPKQGTFTVASIAALPTTLGTVTPEPQRLEMVETVASASCTATVKAAAVHLRVTLSPELEPFLSVARFSTFVDGQLWKESQYGDRSKNFEQGVFDVLKTDVLFAKCRGGIADAHPGLGEGPHTGELRVHVVGAAKDPPPVGFTFTLDCAAEMPRLASGCRVGGSHRGPGVVFWAMLLVFFVHRRFRS